MGRNKGYVKAGKKEDIVWGLTTTIGGTHALKNGNY